MMHVEDIKAMGFKQMHTVQVEALLMFVQDALNLAAMTEDQDIIADVEQTADELVRLFGGNGVSVNYVID
jgi:hypothetical protein|tara:strand:- start:828 stop:1037 length:210 start_codon:yes stop_codon:yes gene_type:complete